MAGAVVLQRCEMHGLLARGAGAPQNQRGGRKKSASRGTIFLQGASRGDQPHCRREHHLAAACVVLWSDRLTDCCVGFFRVDQTPEGSMMRACSPPSSGGGRADHVGVSHGFRISSPPAENSLTLALLAMLSSHPGRMGLAALSA